MFIFVACFSSVPPACKCGQPRRRYKKFYPRPSTRCICRMLWNPISCLFFLSFSYISRRFLSFHLPLVGLGLFLSFGLKSFLSPTIWVCGVVYLLSTSSTPTTITTICLFDTSGKTLRLTISTIHQRKANIREGSKATYLKGYLLSPIITKDHSPHSYTLHNAVFDISLGTLCHGLSRRSRLPRAQRPRRESQRRRRPVKLFQLVGWEDHLGQANVSRPSLRYVKRSTASW